MGNKVYLFSLHDAKDDLSATIESLEELASLSTTMNFKVVGKDYQSKSSPDARSYIGIGKLEELKNKVQEHEIDIVIFDNELTPKQSSFIEKYLGCMIWDRTQLILEIFSNHAQTTEARLQVELARLNYMLPRLVGMWAHLDREKGGIASSKGMGEKQINIDRTLVRNKIKRIEKKLEKIDKERSTQRKGRKSFFKVVLVGYTNAGKSTLINAITGSSVQAEDKLFATLDTTTRKLTGVVKPEILISDTVGFIKKLPHSLVASFRSTLSVLQEADLLLHVVDASRNNLHQETNTLLQNIETTTKVLENLNINIPSLLVLNKMDLLNDKVDRVVLKAMFPNAVMVSKDNFSSIKELVKRMKNMFKKKFVRRTITLPYEKSNLISKFYELSIIEEIEYKEDGIHICQSSTKTNYERLQAAL